VSTRQVLIVGGIVGLLVSSAVLALFWFGVPGLQVLPEYVPPAAVHSRDVLILAVLEHAASGSASRATMAVVMSIFLNINVSFVFFKLRTYRSTCDFMLRKNRANVHCNTLMKEMLDRSAS